MVFLHGRDEGLAREIRVVRAGLELVQQLDEFGLRTGDGDAVRVGRPPGFRVLPTSNEGLGAPGPG